MPQIYYFDTYALIEIIAGSSSYEKYRYVIIVTSRLNLMEVFYSLLHTHSLKEAKRYFNMFFPACIPVSNTTLQTAALFKFKNRKRRLSYFDCIGYQIALELDIKFLTGDKEFKDFGNVEYVK